MHSVYFILNMLGLYLDTLIIGNIFLLYVKYTKWINIAKKCNFYDKHVFWMKIKITQNIKTKKQT